MLEKLKYLYNKIFPKKLIVYNHEIIICGSMIKVKEQKILIYHIMI
jgi:hypothetical protein